MRTALGITVGLAMILTISLAGNVASGASRHAAIPCWERLLNQAYTGQITTIFPARCYTEALDRFPTEPRRFVDGERGFLQAAKRAAEHHQLPPRQATLLPCVTSSPGPGLPVTACT
jgi:hypothetical protein